VADHRPELSHLRRSRRHHRVEQRAVHPLVRSGAARRPVRAAARQRTDARVLSWPRAGARQPRRDARQDLSPGRRSLVGLSHTGRRAAPRSGHAHPALEAEKPAAMIVETIVTTLAEDGAVNVAPMGVEWGDEVIVLKPFLETATYRNVA